MSFLYIDTSAFVKRYRQEPGTEVVNEVFKRYRKGQIITSYLTFLEISAVVERQIKVEAPEDNIENTRQAASKDFEQYVITLPLEEPAFLCQSHNFILKYSLRAPDSMQLSACVGWRNMFHSDIVFLCADRELHDAAAGEGFAVIDPTAADAISRLASYPK